MPPITTLDRVKAKLQIPLSDTAQDEAIQLVIDGVEEWIADRTHFDIRATAHTDIFEQCQIGRVYVMKRRPIDSAQPITAQGRTYGVPSNWIDLVADPVDPERGRLMLLGVANFFQTFPPVEPPSSYFKWSQPKWPIVRFNYTTKNPVYPADLQDAASAFATFLFHRQLTGHLVSASLGSISETYAARGIGGGVPDHIANVIDSYTADLAQWTP